MADGFFKGSLSIKEQQLMNDFAKDQFNKSEEKLPKHVDSEELSKQIWKQIEKETRQQLWFGFSRKMVYTAAACVVGILLIPVGFYNYTYRTIEFKTGQQIDSLSLPDGSKVYLATNSIFQYPAKFSKNKREVSLINGAAFFKVKRNVVKPFQVASNDVLTTVLGTSFLINSHKNCTAVSVATGKVRVSKNKYSVDLIPFEKAIAKNKTINKVKESNSNFKNWMLSEVYFKNATLEEVVKFLAVKFQVNTEFSNVQIASQKLNFKIQQQTPLKEIVSNLKFITQLNYKLYDEKLIISKNTETK
ncbi:ferric-dicitrate binding protein FerR (iron transport regulator) [Wenyingzhuangia heitensis]|uniref:Ferric-dicitrate binding protein FerR (Iron transport regulator) n=1 Tax=Wenyingzhuangia heitensis TaxID=1487859 RepID=A0ABX0U688_9FLAO|nr:FecR family protein [Wenyingzhuangia heitensis]NIJ44362.1 ferric-dicitrate binding protein FerR (iron transport regulator) [Wenyingzhuangia heitensis]